jgi:hypothetical protein
LRRPSDLQAAAIEAALAACRRDPAKAALQLGVSERGLKLRMRELGLER